MLICVGAFAQGIFLAQQPQNHTKMVKKCQV